MKAITKIIFRLNVLILLFIFIINSGCSDDPSSPTKTEEEIPTTTATIGAAGGTVGTDEISITIPAGAFTTNHEISIYDEPDYGAFGEYSVSNFFKIGGLPNDNAKPLKIKMKYTGELNENGFIAFGTKTFDIINGDSSLIYSLYNATDSSGYLIGEISLASESIMPKINSNSFNSANDNIKEDIYLHLCKGYRTKETQNFAIMYPPPLEGYISDVENIFESTLSIIRNDLEINFYQDQPKGIVLLKFQDKRVGSKFNGYQGTLFNVSISEVIANLVTNGELQISAAENLIDRELWYRGITPSIWYKNAVFNWMAELFTTSSSYKYPESFLKTVIAPFNGLHAGSGESESSNNYILGILHGTGMSSVLKYLTEDDRYGKAGIGKTFAGISQSVSTTTSLLNTMDALIADWWPDFFKEYVSGNIYNVPIDSFLVNVTDSWEVSNMSDTLKTFTNTYPDLSAKMFSVTLNRNDFEETDNMLFSMDANSGLDGLALVMFGIKNGEAEYLETAHAEGFEIPNLKSYYDDGMKQFLVVLVNNLVTSDDYLGKTDIDLLVRVKKQLKLDYNSCLVALKFIGNVLVDYVSIPDQYTTIVGMSQNASTGSFSGNTFYGSYNDGGETGSLTVTLNDELNLVTEMTWSGRMEYSNSTTELGFSAVNIPISSTLNNMYIIKGSNTCDVITDAHYQNKSDTKTSTLIDYTCDEFSYIEILFDKK